MSSSKVDQESIHIKRILIVDDNAVNRMVLGGFVKSLTSAEITFAENGLQAVASYIEKGADLVFMDISMPELDGLAATQKIRSFEEKNNIPITPVLAVTAHIEDEMRLKCKAVGMNDHIGKPISMDVISTALQPYGDLLV